MRTIESIQPNEVVHCKTQEEATAFCEMLDRSGKTWASGKTYKLAEKWETHKNKTYYRPFYGVFGNVDGPSTYTILTLSDFLPETTDPVNHPTHYGGADNPYEAIKIIEHYGLNFSDGNVLKYFLRAGKKSKETELQDLEKAAFYLNRRISQLKDSK